MTDQVERLKDVQFLTFYSKIMTQDSDPFHYQHYGSMKYFFTNRYNSQLLTAVA